MEQVSKVQSGMAKTPSNPVCPECKFTPLRDAEPLDDIDTYEDVIDYFEICGCDDGNLMCPRCAKEFAVGLSDKVKVERRVWKRRPNILLCPNIPAPMHGLAPRVVLGQAWWNKTRREAYLSTNLRCQACGVHKYKAKSKQWLEGHELYLTDYRAGRLTYVETVPLCHYCHNFIHDGRMLALVRQGKMPQGKYISVIQHGNRVLADANLQRKTHAEREADIARKIQMGEMAEWDTWRLILFDKEYPPIYSTHEEWEAAHGESIEGFRA